MNFICDNYKYAISFFSSLTLFRKLLKMLKECIDQFETNYSRIQNFFLCTQARRCKIIKFNFTVRKK